MLNSSQVYRVSWTDADRGVTVYDTLSEKVAREIQKSNFLTFCLTFGQRSKVARNARVISYLQRGCITNPIHPKLETLL